MSGAERREAILSQAIQDPRLVACVSPVIAAGFGIVPLRRLGDTLTVACSPRANPLAIRLLREILDVEVVATPFEEHLLRDAIDQAYLQTAPAVNFPTFADPDFLEDPDVVDVLREEKEEVLGEVGARLEGDRVVLATLAFFTRLIDADAPAPGQALPRLDRTRMHLGDLEVAWRAESEGPVLYGVEPPPPGGLVLTQYRESEYRHLRGGGWIDDHGVESEVGAEFPVVVHPTEVQILGTSARGGLRLHLYDAEVEVDPGAESTHRVEYHFLSYGSRLTRQIELKVLELVCAERSALRVRPGPCPWGPRELERWLR